MKEKKAEIKVDNKAFLILKKILKGVITAICIALFCLGVYGMINPALRASIIELMLQFAYEVEIMKI